MSGYELVGWYMLGIGAGIAVVHLWQWWQDRQWRNRHK